MESFNVGPFGVSVRMGIFILAILAAFAIGNWLARQRGVAIERKLWTVLLVGVVSARLAFVLTYWETYAASPLTMLDIRDGGLNAVTGATGALLMAITFAVRGRDLRPALLGAFISGTTVFVSGTVAFEASAKPASLPAVSLQAMDGSSIDITSFHGRPVVLNLWATWCPPCRREMPVLMEAQRSNPDVVFVFANQGEGVETVKSYLDLGKLRLNNVLLDPRGAVAKHIGSVALPTTVFYNSKGERIRTRVGELSAATLIDGIKTVKDSGPASDSETIKPAPPRQSD